MITQRLVAPVYPSPANPNITMDATYTWDNEGRVTARTYPSINGSPGNTYAYQFDTMGRLNHLLENGTQQATAAYGPANEMTSLSYYGYSETRTYNNLLQLTRQTVPGVFDTEYVFPGGANNGQISASIDHISGQQANYTYDSLKRLSTAGAAGAWGQSYSYDGFGNLTAATVTQGSGVNFAQAYDPGTNHAVGNGQFQYDANGNQMFYASVAYDGENRMTLGNGNLYTYDPSGKRVWANVNGSASGTLYFYDIFGKMIETVTVDATYGVTGGAGNIYFGSRLIVSSGKTVVTDRLGSVRADATGQKYAYLPYGIEQTSTPNGQVKFGTYLRDGNSSTLGADYADQRYYNPWFGRFNTADSSSDGMAAQNPGSWNHYVYMQSDPINGNDPNGTAPCWFRSDFGPVDPDPTREPCSEPLPALHCPFPSGLEFAPGSFCGGVPGVVFSPAPKKPAPPPCDPGFLADEADIVGAKGQSFSGADINFAARVIFAESSGDTAEDMAMANVIFNRLDNTGFRNADHSMATTLTQVVTQLHQFNAVTPPGPNKQFVNSGPGLYQYLSPADCAHLANSIQAMTSTVIGWPVYEFTFFVAATLPGYSGTQIGGSIFW